MTNTRKKLAGKPSKLAKDRPKQTARPAKLNDFKAGSFPKGNSLEVSLHEADLETVEQRRKTEFLLELQDLVRIIDEQIT